MKITHKLTYEGKCGKHSEFDECTVIKNINLQYTISNPIKQLHVILFLFFACLIYSPLPVTQTNENNFHSINFKYT